MEFTNIYCFSYNCEFLCNWDITMKNNIPDYLSQGRMFDSSLVITDIILWGVSFDLNKKILSSEPSLEWINLYNINKLVDQHFQTWSDNKIERQCPFCKPIDTISFICLFFLLFSNAIAHYQHANHAFTFTCFKIKGSRRQAQSM